MGSRSFVEMNIALQEKWILRYMSEKDKLWERIVETRWGSIEGGGTAREVARPHGRGLWKKLSMESQKFKECINWKVSRGNKILFQEDECVGRGSLKTHFLRVYAIAQSKSISVEESYRDGNGGSEWIVNVNQNLNIERLKSMKPCYSCPLCN